MLQDKNSEIRIKAAEGLGHVGGRQSVMILRQGLSDKNLEVRIAVVKALGFIGGGGGYYGLIRSAEGQRGRGAHSRCRGPDGCWYCEQHSHHPKSLWK